MYRGFNLKLDKSIFEDYHEYEYYIDRGRKEINRTIQTFKNCILGEDSILDGNKIMEKWFPKEIGKDDIFLSHSHNDLDLALAIAGKLEEKHNLKVFIDSVVWGNCNDLLRQIDDKYCIHRNRISYDYDKRNYSTSHVHMMLMNSLNLMIDECEALFFLNTPNSISLKDDIGGQSKTISPWIFSEITTSRIIRKKIPERIQKKKKEEKGELKYLSESNKNFRIKYDAKLDHLSNLDNEIFKNWLIQKFDKAEYPLDWLYNEIQI